MSIFGELQLTHISLNFKTFCCNSKISGLGKKSLSTQTEKWKNTEIYSAYENA